MSPLKNSRGDNLDELDDITVTQDEEGWWIYDPIANLLRGPYDDEKRADHHVTTLIEYYYSGRKPARLPCGCVWYGRGALRCSR